MASQLEFEGPVLEDLLEKVRAEVGPDARIVAANRIRRGGVGGFFAREAYEVLVEPPDDGTSCDGTGDDGTSDDVLDVVADDDGGLRFGATEPAPTVVANRTPQPTIAPPAAAPIRRKEASIPASNLLQVERPPVTSAHATVQADEHAAMTARHATILELADAVSEHERSDVIDLIEERNMATQSRDFAQVLDRFSKTVDPAGADADTVAPRDLGTRAPEIDIREPSHSENRAPSEAVAAGVTPTVEDASPAPAREEHDEHDDDLQDDRYNDGPDPERVPRVRRSAQALAPTAEVIDRYETRLSKMGLPARLIPRGASQQELKGALVESLTRLPPAPSVSSALGVVIAIVGTGSAPVLLARELALDLNVDPDDVVLATREQLGFGIPAWLQMSDAATAQERRRSWRRRNRPTIVACSLPRDGLGWARDMLDELEPTVTWAIVDAGAKREDIVHRIDALGGVDVLALDNLDATVSPGTVLELGIPVGRLEHEHASPLTWTELFLERMSS